MSCILFLAVVLACLQLSSAVCTELPVRLAGRVVPPSDSEEPTCPSDAERQSIREDLDADLDQLIESNLHIFQNLAVPVQCPGVGWVKVVDFNLETNSEKPCPGAWEKNIDEGVPHCRIPNTQSNEICASANFSTNSLSYSQVCGRLKGYQIGQPSAFLPSSENPFIDDPYLDGAFIARGSPRQHVWSFGAGFSSTQGFGTHRCFCSVHSGPFINKRFPREFVGNNSFCESGTDGEPDIGSFYSLNPLWDAEGCPDGSQCCSRGGPYFSTTLPGATCDPLEVRMCVYDTNLVNIGLSVIELYVK